MNDDGYGDMTLSQLQKQHKLWAERNFPDAKRWEPLIGIQEEVGELSHAFLKMHQGIRTNEDHGAKMLDAVGDILIFMADFCNRNGIDMQEAMESTWATVSRRDWKSDRKNGNGCCFSGGKEECSSAGESVPEKDNSKLFVWGRYEKLGREIGELVDTKNQAYGNSFHWSGAILKQMYPDGIIPNQYDDMLFIVRILDKLFRIANDKDAFGESPYRDIAGYGILGAAGKVNA